MSTTEMRGGCEEVEASLGDLLDGTASARLHDHLAGCDACRDLKHEAARVVARLGDAGADFRPADDFVERLVGRLKAARPASSGPSASAPALHVEGARWQAHAASIHDGATARSGLASPGASGGEAAATVFDPLAATKAAEGEVATGGLVAFQTAPGASAPAPVAMGETPEPLAQPATLVPPAPAPSLRQAAPRAKSVWLGRPVLVAGAISAMAAAAAVGFYLKGRGAPPDPPADAPWSGVIASVARASADPTGGLEACDAAGRCAPIAAGAQVRAGTTLRTDSRTRAHVALADGTELAIDRASELAFAGGARRAARLARGALVADVAHVEGSPARIAFSLGEVEVPGTKLAITAGGDRASVEVARGSVRVKSDAGRTVEVRAGEEATLAGDADPVVSSAATLAGAIEWSDERPEDAAAPLLRGLGELRARKPGQTKEKDHAVRLARHAVSVRIVDVMARTEVDETFTNDTDEELEGIFRFPLPPGAQIENLSLEVSGKMVDGAFVDRDKGAAIWRGVIHNAAPKAPRPREEILWVPGPWRDPALLEWQRGGRFELKIFPIPRRGSRRVAITYTQVVEQDAKIRRFTYPLAHDPSGSTRIGAFDLDVQVLGYDPSKGISTRGYELVQSGDRRTLHAGDFVPAGDLTVEYALPGRDAEVTAWAYAPAPAPPGGAPAVDVAGAPGRPGSAPAPGSAQPVTKPQALPAEEKEAARVASAILDDRSPYVALALRPRLPRWQEARERLHVVVVDASRSMFGERFSRATHLAAAIVREMDRRDTFVLLACDTVCRALTTEPDAAAQPTFAASAPQGRALPAIPRPGAPGAQAADDVERFLGGIEPDGGSDLAASMAAARAAAGSLGGKELRILYLGDGTPSVGPTRPSHLEAAVRGALPAGDGAVVAVALGADADTPSLAALARGGGGVVVPYVPGQRIASAALEVLGAAYGVVLRDPEVELPAGLSQVTPARLDSIRAGGETILVARMTSGHEVSGDLRLRGRVAGERFEQTYPLKVVASASAGNAFVPRLYAAAKIAELEQAGGETQRATVIELSRRFAVASRFTSLLVLESEAMFRAFGLERSASAPSFTGEQKAESSTARADGDPPADDASASLDVGSLTSAGPAHHRARRAEGGGELGDSFDKSPGSASVQGGAAPAASAPGFGEGARAEAASPPPPPAPAPTTATKKAASAGDAPANDPWGAVSRRRRFVPMRRVFDRHVSFDQANTFVGQNAARVVVAESALAATPDSRDRTVELFGLYATSGRLGEAQELTAKWAGRDALDPDALQARADLAARQGDRARALRILGGLADVRPDDRAVQARLADLWDTAGEAAFACEHRLALADIAPSDPKLVSAAITCARAQGEVDLASVIHLDTTDKVRESVDKLLAQQAPPAGARGARAARGDVQITATWSGGADLDLALVDARGGRTSWLGSSTRATVSARDVERARAETLELAGLPQGSYLLEITRATGGDAGDVVRGEVRLNLNGEVRNIPFVLPGARAELGTIRVFFTSHLERADVPWGGGGRGGPVF